MGNWHRETMKCEGSGRSILNNIDTHEEVAVHMSGFDGIRRGNYFRGEPTGRAEVEVRMDKLKMERLQVNEITGEMIKGGGDWVVD